MSRSSLFRIALISALASPLVSLAACSSDASGPSEPQQAYAGDATAAQLKTVLETKADDWGWAGGQFDAPADQAVLSAAAPFDFTWHSASTDSAEAGAPAVTQMTYLLVFSTPKQGLLLRVFTTVGDYTPDAATWQKLVGAAEPITLTVTTATFDGSELTVDGGPHEGQTLTFTIE